MNVTIIGGSGFIGRHLSAALQQRGDRVAVVSFRDPGTVEREVDGSDVVVNLAGENIAARWTPDIKRKIRSSRIDLPRQLIESFPTLKKPPKAYISASAIGYYGTSETETFTETSPPGSDFLAKVCVDWEAEAQKASLYRCRVAIVRTGLVLGKDGGVMARLLPLFKLGLGGPVGSGSQWCSWVHIDDVVGIYMRAIDGLNGVLNATAPNPVRNRDFAQALAGALHRPALVTVPAFAVEAVLGEAALVLTKGQCVIPQRTTASRYEFRYTLVNRACNALLVRS